MARREFASNLAKFHGGASEKGTNMKRLWIIGLVSGIACLASMAGVSFGVSVQLPVPVGVSVQYPGPVYVPPVVVAPLVPAPMVVPAPVFAPVPLCPPPPVVVYRPVPACHPMVVAPWPRHHHHHRPYPGGPGPWHR